MRPTPTAVLEKRISYALRRLAQPGIDQYPGIVDACQTALDRSRAELASRRTGVPCLRCGLPLTDPISVTAGIGPCCARKARA